jgi:IS4 transposase
MAAIYKLHWQIELLFKQLKQNFPLKYFLGDNENVIKIHIYLRSYSQFINDRNPKNFEKIMGIFKPSKLLQNSPVQLYSFATILRKPR